MARLTKLYPGKNIVLNSPEFHSEVICELDAVSQTHAIGVIDFIRPHYHKINTEIYELLRVNLLCILRAKQYYLKRERR